MMGTISSEERGKCQKILLIVFCLELTTSNRQSEVKRSGISDQKLAELEFKIGLFRNLMRMQHKFPNKAAHGVVDFDTM